MTAVTEECDSEYVRSQELLGTEEFLIWAIRDIMFVSTTHLIPRLRIVQYRNSEIIS